MTSGWARPGTTLLKTKRRTNGFHAALKKLHAKLKIYSIGVVYLMQKTSYSERGWFQAGAPNMSLKAKYQGKWALI